MIITPEHIELLKTAEQKRSTSSLVTRVLLLKAEGKSHTEIADVIGISKSYVNHMITQTRKAAKLTK